MNEVTKAMLTLFPQPGLNFDRFGFLFMGINRKYPENGVAMLGLRKLKPKAVAGVLMTCQYRLENIEGDAYAIAISTEDGNKEQRLFVYTTIKEGEGDFIDDTDILMNIRNEKNEKQLYPVSEHDWVYSDPMFIKPDPRYRALFTPVDERYREIGHQLDRHPAMQQAQQIYGGGTFTTSTIMLEN